MAWTLKESDVVTGSVIRRVQGPGELQNEELISLMLNLFMYLSIYVLTVLEPT